MKKIVDFYNEPLFSMKEVCDAISCVTMCITEASIHGDLNYHDWQEYIQRWCRTSGMPEELQKHMEYVIRVNIEALLRHE